MAGRPLGVGSWSPFGRSPPTRPTKRSLFCCLGQTLSRLQRNKEPSYRRATEELHDELHDELQDKLQERRAGQSGPSHERGLSSGLT